MQQADTFMVCARERGLWFPFADIAHDVAVVVGQDLLAGLGQQTQGNVVAHGARGHKQRSLAPEHLGSATFEVVHGRVFAISRASSNRYASGTSPSR